MVNGAILPYQPAGRVIAVHRQVESSPAGDDFAGAMDDALDTRASRHADGAKASRRADSTRPHEASANKAPAPGRKAASSKKVLSAKKADPVDEPQVNDVERDDEPSTDGGAVTDSLAQPAEAAKTAGDATEPGETSADAFQGTEVAVATAAAAADAPTVTVDSDGNAAVPDEKIARGPHWDAAVEKDTGEPAKPARTGAARAVAGAISKGTQRNQPVTGPPIQTGAASGAPLAEALPRVDAGAADEASARSASHDGVVTQAVETSAAKPQTASAADAVTAIETAVANVESAPVAETAHSDTHEGGMREQAQPKSQAAGPQLNPGEAVPTGAPPDGVRFTVNGAAGNAAYTNAAPRQEEAVLPQIVQSIRLHAVQGTTEARVQLKPEHLGALTITLKVEQSQVTATIQADVAAVRAWIESHESSLRQALSEQGLQLARLVVEQDGQQASKDEQQGEPARRQPRRRSWRDEEATFEVLA